MRPTLVAFVDGVERGRLEPPADFGARSWLLAVIAVQATVERGRAVAVLRINATGAPAPQVIELSAPARVDVAFVAPGAEPAPLPDAPALAPGDGARLRLCVDGQVAADSALPRALAAAHPAPRGFAHAYSRWLRDGGHESGYDLTKFQSAEKGNKYQRLVAQDATAGQVVTIFFATAAETSR